MTEPKITQRRVLAIQWRQKIRQFFKILPAVGFSYQPAIDCQAVAFASSILKYTAGILAEF